MRRKDASAIKIKDTRENTDSSMHTTKLRLAASQIFPVGGAPIGAVNSGDYSSMAPKNGVMSYQKHSGGSVKDASTFSAYRGGKAIGSYVQSGIKPSRVELGNCYTIEPTVPSQSSSDFVRRVQGCNVSLGEPHHKATVDKPKFVDNTIRNLGDPSLCTVPVPNHGVKTENAHVSYHPRPAMPDKGNLEPGKDAAALGGNSHYKPGAAIRRPQNFQIFKNDNNTKTTTTKSVPTKYQIPAGTPAHLRINDPTQVVMR